MSSIEDQEAPAIGVYPLINRRHVARDAHNGGNRPVDFRTLLSGIDVAAGVIAGQPRCQCTSRANPTPVIERAQEGEDGS
jgi:hypothetical protein